MANHLLQLSLRRVFSNVTIKTQFGHNLVLFSKIIREQNNFQQTVFHHFQSIGQFYRGIKNTK